MGKGILSFLTLSLCILCSGANSLAAGEREIVASINSLNHNPSPEARDASSGLRVYSNGDVARFRGHNEINVLSLVPTALKEIETLSQELGRNNLNEGDQANCHQGDQQDTNYIVRNKDGQGVRVFAIVNCKEYRRKDESKDQKRLVQILTELDQLTSELQP